MPRASIALRLLALGAVVKADENYSADCYSNWAGTWKDEENGWTLTLTQHGCDVTALHWDQNPNGGYYQSKEVYKASGDVLKPTISVLSYTIQKDGNSACCCHGKCIENYRWTRTAPEPPKPPLPSCLPVGGCPIQFADGLKPPCCKGVTSFRYGGPCQNHVFGGYPTSGYQCVTCIAEYNECEGEGKQGGCCDGLECKYEGWWGCRKAAGTNTTNIVV